MSVFSKFRIILIVAALMMTGCAVSPDAKSSATSEQTPSVQRPGQLYFAAQPDAEGLASVERAGVEIVINLREPGEIEWDEAAAAAALGLDYYNIPVARSSDSFDPAAIAAITRIVDTNPYKNILLHCSTGNRASAWYAIYLIDKHGIDRERGLAQARATGLDRAEMEQRVVNYLEQRR